MVHSVTSINNEIGSLIVQNNQTQECIPVGCIPPASVAVSGGWGCLPGDVSPGGVCPGGVCLGGCLPHPTPRGQTDACENITLPQTLFAGGDNIHALQGSCY